MRLRMITGRQKIRFFYSVLIFTVLCLLNYVLGAEEEEPEYLYKGDYFKHREEALFERGEIVEFSNKEEVCGSWVLLPGINLMSDRKLATLYFLALIYLFLGISIVSDIFMGAIEEITAKTSIMR